MTLETHTFSYDLSAFNIGDTCHATGAFDVRFSGTNHAYATLDTTFIWQASNIISCSGNWTSGSTTYTYTYTVTLTTTTQTVVTSVSPENSYGSDTYINIGLYKPNNPWVQVQKAYKKVNGSWVEQSDLTTVFDSNKSYIHSSTVAEV